MDKHEYRQKTEQMLKCLENKSYKEAYEIAESIDWRKVKNVAVLCAVSEVYEYNGEYQKGRDILFLAYDRQPDSKKIIYRLGTLALKLNEVKEAMDCYEEFIALAPNDPNRFVFKYKILKSKNAPISEQIAVLEEFKKVEYVEKWAFELAGLYKEAGMISECLEECDDLILWFSEGKYIYKAMELKMQYKPLTPLQHEKYMSRLEEEKTPVAEETPVVEDVPAVEETTVEDPPIMEEATTVVETPVEVAEEIAPEVVVAEEPAEELTPEEATVEVNSAEEVQEVEEVQEEVVQETVAENKPTMSIEEIVQDWQEQQMENAQMIQAEFERAEQEKAEIAAEVEKAEEEKEEILSDDVRKLMEELEAESAEIDAQKTAKEIEEVVEDKPLLQKVVEQLSAMEIKLSGKEEIDEFIATPDEPTSSPATESMDVPEIDITYTETADIEKMVAKEVEDMGELQPSAEKATAEEGIKLGDTQEIALSAKALASAARVEVPDETPLEELTVASDVIPPYQPEEPSNAGTPYDTGFVVQGRYDLEAHSEIGLKAGLTEEQKKLFSYFVPVHGMSEQIVRVLQEDKRCKSRYGTSRIGNVLIVGRRGSGKTVLAVNIVKAIQKSRKMKHGKVAIVKAEALNNKDVNDIVEKLHGGALVIEKASRLKRNTIDNLCELMEGQTGELLVVLEDERKPIERLLNEFPNFGKKFSSRIDLPVFINDELVTFGQTYAKENGYKIDEMGILALYSDIDILQREEKVVTVADVKAIIDDAIENANRTTLKKLVKKLVGKNKDESDRIILKEEDFR
ncbi:MAG: hypothetical protein IJE60_03630 [Tyzzerella sp.]|nr:hypothetical protein [Tyzzerella sp.]